MTEHTGPRNWVKGKKGFQKVVKHAPTSQPLGRADIGDYQRGDLSFEGEPGAGVVSGDTDYQPGDLAMAGEPSLAQEDGPMLNSQTSDGQKRTHREHLNSLRGAERYGSEAVTDAAHENLWHFESEMRRAYEVANPPRRGLLSLLRGR